MEKKTSKQIIGAFGENLALRYLQKKGFKILARNIKISYQEIDIIANFKEITVFIEVRTKTTLAWGTAEESINNQKFANLQKAMTKYVYQYNLDPEKVRLDFVAVFIDKYKKIANIKHFIDIL